MIYAMRQQARASHSGVCTVIDNKFRHKFVKVVCGSTRLSLCGSIAALQYYYEIHEQKQDRRMRNLHQFVKPKISAQS